MNTEARSAMTATDATRKPTCGGWNGSEEVPNRRTAAKSAAGASVIAVKYPGDLRSDDRLRVATSAHGAEGKRNLHPAPDYSHGRN